MGAPRRGAIVRMVCAAVVGSVLHVVATPPSSALSPGISFSADALPTWQTDGIVWALGQTHGRVIAGGKFTTLTPPAGGSEPPIATSALAILDAETGAPDPCQLPVRLDVPGLTPIVRSIATAPDGTVYIGGDFSNVGGVDVGRLAAIDVVSCTVKAFHTERINSVVRTVAHFGDTVYFGGDFDQVEGAPRQRFAAVDAVTGDLLPWVVDVEAPGRALAVSPDGSKVAVGGDFFSVNGAPSHSIAVVDGETGANLRTYPGDFIDDKSVTKHIWSGSERFYVSNEARGFGNFDGRLAISWTTLDQEWRDTCRGATQASIEYAGTLYSASHAHNCGDTAYQDGRRNFFNAQDARTAELLGWDPRANDGIGEGLGPRALTIAVGRSTGEPYLWAGGEFTQINRSPQQSLTRFSAADVGAPPTPLPVAVATTDGTVQVRWRTSIDPDDSHLEYSLFRNGSRRPLWSGTAVSLWWKYPQVTYVDRNVRAGRLYSYRVRVTDGTNQSEMSRDAVVRALEPGASYGRTVRADRPTLYWSSERIVPASLWLQEVGARRTSVRRVNGQAAGGALLVGDTPVRGDSSGSIKFDGIDDYLWEDEFVAAPRVYSVEAWFKTRTRDGGGIIGYGDGRPHTSNNRRLPSTAGRYDRVVYLTNKGRVRFGVRSDRPVTIKSRRTYNDGKWHHVVATQGPRGMALYLDGTRVGRHSTTRAGSYLGVWHVGGDNLAGFPARPRSTMFRGKIDEFAVYPKVLKRKRVVAHLRAARRAQR